MEPRVSLITLGVADLDRSTKFYRDGLGWPLSGASTPEVSFFRTAGAIVGLYPRALLAEDANLPPGGSGFGGITLAHNVRERPDVAAVVERAVAAGATVLKPPQATTWGGYHAYFADPDGHPWEIAWNPFFPILPDGSLQLPE